jgi:hypothetical protein
MIHRPTFLKRVPRLRWTDRPPEAIVPEDVRARYSTLAGDLKLADDEVEPRFQDADRRALRVQNTFRLERVGLIVGSLVVTVLGSIQAAAGGGILPLGLVQGALAAAVAAGTLLIKSRTTQRDYFTLRKKAELLRGEYFLFVGRVGRYAGLDDDARAEALRARVLALEEAE